MTKTQKYYLDKITTAITFAKASNNFMFLDIHTRYIIINFRALVNEVNDDRIYLEVYSLNFLE